MHARADVRFFRWEIYFYCSTLEDTVHTQFLVTSQLHLLSLLFSSLGEFIVTLALCQSNVVRTLAVYQDPMSCCFATARRINFMTPPKWIVHYARNEEERKDVIDVL
jgi:hypothetical protein